MALIEYNIHYANGKTSVTCSVVQVDKGDRILFKSKDANTGIRYVGQSPFKGPDGPQADQVFDVGKDPGPFEVTVPSHGTLRHFDCGKIEAAEGTAVGHAHAMTHTTFTPWKGGGSDTP
jgi:hypothetical protein